MTQPISDLLNQIHVAVIRLDVRFDLVSKKQDDHEIRIRTLETRPYVSPENFQKLEERSYVSPSTLWKVVGLLTSVAAIGLTIIGLIVK